MITIFIPPKDSLKNLIINLLLKNGKLSVNELKKNIKEVFNISTTYQGVNKAIKQLEEAEIIEVFEKKYVVNAVWIDQVINTLKEYPKNNVTIYTKDIKELEFRSISEALTFILNNIESGALLNSGEKIVIGHFNNLGFYGLDKNQIRIMRNLPKTHRCIYMMAQDNFVTRASAQFFKKAKYEIYLGVPKSTPHIVGIFGNTMVTVLSEKGKHYLSRLYDKITSIEDERMLEIYESPRLENKFDIRVLFETDPQIVKDTKEHLLGLISKAKKL